MKKSEVVIGAVYKGKGSQVSSERKIQLLRIIPQVEGPERVLTRDLETGVERWANLRSFMVSYSLESLPPKTIETEPVLTETEMRDIMNIVRRAVERSKASH